MIRPARPALAALEAGIAHVALHGRVLPETGAATVQRRLALRVALNVVREFDTLLGHAVAETAAIAGVVVPVGQGTPVRLSFAALVGALAPGRATPNGLAQADRVRDGLVRALASPGALARHRLPIIYPHAIGASYRRVAGELALLVGEPVRGADQPGLALPARASVSVPLPA